jgi:hypothetical protein
MFRFLFLFLLFLSPLRARAVEIYSVLTHNCELVTGLIIDINDTEVGILDMDGKFRSVVRNEVEFLVVHNTLQNPYSKILLNDRTVLNQLDIYVGGSEKKLFSGWAVKFIEDLVIFFDDSGGTHVLELNQISKIRPTVITTKTHIDIRGAPVLLKMGNIFFRCPMAQEKHKNNSGGVLPTRTLGDKVQISEFLSNFELGFQRLQSFKERTYLYARPFLYEKKTKLGITSNNKYFQNIKSDFPFYYQWSTGEPYRFQSFNQLGNVGNEYVPSAEPFFLARSDVKSHLFHATFVGNLQALPAGTDFYTEKKGVIDSELLNNKNMIVSSPSLNYLALMGADYGPWSFSFGTYYPTYMIRYLNENTSVDYFREILAAKVSPMFRLMYTLKKLQVRGVISRTSYEENSGVNDKQLSVDLNTSVIGLIKSYNFDSDFLRVGANYQINKNVQVGLDQIFLSGNYAEDTITDDRNSIEFDHLVTSVFIRHFFGEKVTLGANASFVNIKESIKIESTSDSEDLSEISLGGAFEFVF